MKDHDRYLELAAQARADADKATLANVRERCLRAEAAWRVMADRVERTEKMRVAHEAAKAGAAAAAAASVAAAADLAAAETVA